jgi:hypothetical protein
MMRLEGLGQLKNPVTSSGIEPVTNVSEDIAAFIFKVDSSLQMGAACSFENFVPTY